MEYLIFLLYESLFLKIISHIKHVFFLPYCVHILVYIALFMFLCRRESLQQCQTVSHHSHLCCWGSHLFSCNSKTQPTIIKGLNACFLSLINIHLVHLVPVCSEQLNWVHCIQIKIKLPNDCHVQFIVCKILTCLTEIENK